VCSRAATEASSTTGLRCCLCREGAAARALRLSHPPGRSVAYFNLEEYESAKAAFEAAHALEARRETATWIRKCDAELHGAAPQQPCPHAARLQEAQVAPPLFELPGKALCEAMTVSGMPPRALLPLSMAMLALSCPSSWVGCTQPTCIHVRHTQGQPAAAAAARESQHAPQEPVAHDGAGSFAGKLGVHGHASAHAPSRQPLSARRHVRGRAGADEAGAAPGAAEPAAPPPPAAPRSALQPEAEPSAQTGDAAADAAKPLAPAAPEQPAAKYRHQYFQTATARRRRACTHSKALCACT